MKLLRVRLAVVWSIFLCTIVPGVAAQEITTFVEADDGVLLATDVHLPDGDGPWPAVLRRTPVGRGSADCSSHVAQGYACVVQDQRAFGDSEGGYEFLQLDGADGRATIEWISDQSWCDGNVGGLGNSVSSLAQYMQAPGAPEALKCLTPGLATPDMFHQWAFQGGALREELIVGTYSALGEQPVTDLLLQHRLRDDWWDGLQQAIQHPELITAPGLHVGGWYDVFSQGTLDGFSTFQADGGEGARGRQKLIMGPWPHGVSMVSGHLIYPENAVIDVESLRTTWLDRWLKGEDNHAEDWPKAYVFLMGPAWSPIGIPLETDVPGNVWLALEGWPPPSSPASLFLGADGGLWWADSFVGELELRMDPDDPVPTHGGPNHFIPIGPYDQRELEGRDDVLVFTTEELAAPVTVMGRITCSLWIRPDTTDLDLAVRLSDVYPTGHSMLVTDGIQRARMRCSDEAECFLTPGEPTEIVVDLWSTALVFDRGHKIRISVSGSNWPRFEVNPNHGGDLDGELPGVIARPDLLFGPEYPSRLILPIWTPLRRDPVERDSWKTSGGTDGVMRMFRALERADVATTT